MKSSLKYSDLTDRIIKCYYTVYNKLGHGFLEKVYENSLLIELRKAGMNCQKQVAIDVFYDVQKVGEYYADIIVEDKVILELKAAETLCDEHECQLTNYLRATKIEVGLLLIFGKTPQIKRKVFNNEYKIDRAFDHEKS
jgi:GxxExxY protein